MSGRAVTECVPQPQTHCLEVRQPRTYAAQCSLYQIPNTKKLDTVKYSKTPIYRASRGKGKTPGKSGDTVNRGTGKIDQNSAYLRFKIINYAMHLHRLVYAFFEFK